MLLPADGISVCLWQWLVLWGELRLSIVQAAAHTALSYAGGGGSFLQHFPLHLGCR